jgi:hypothetical protein
MITRRQLLRTAGAALAATGLDLPEFSKADPAEVGLSPGVPQGLRSINVMVSLPGKKPLIQLSDRPPNRTQITPNGEFFIHNHLADIPEIDVKSYKISVGGEGANGRAEPAFEVVAVNQCEAADGRRRNAMDAPRGRCDRTGIRRDPRSAGQSLEGKDEHDADTRTTQSNSSTEIPAEHRISVCVAL